MFLPTYIRRSLKNRPRRKSNCVFANQVADIHPRPCFLRGESIDHPEDLALTGTSLAFIKNIAIDEDLAYQEKTGDFLTSNQVMSAFKPKD
jgi:hypothetical protein